MNRLYVGSVLLVQMVFGYGWPVATTSALQTQPSGTKFFRVSTSMDDVGTGGWHFDSSSTVNTSYDGRYVAYQSSATDLIYGDTNNTSDIFVKDNQTDLTERVSLDSSNAQFSTPSTNVVMSSNARYVAFCNIDESGNYQTFVRDRSNGTTLVASSDVSGNVAGANSGTTPLSVSDNGKVLMQAGSSTNLISGYNATVNNLLLKDLTTGAIQQAPFFDPTGNGDTWGSITAGQLSADGNSLAVSAFDSTTNLRTSTNIAVSQIVWVDMQNSSSKLVTPASLPHHTWATYSLEVRGISRTGDYVLFWAYDNTLLANSAYANLYETDIANNVIKPVNPLPTGRSINGQVVGDAQVSDDGKYVGFMSSSTNLDPNNNPTQVSGFSLYVRDMTASYATMVVNQAVHALHSYAPGASTFAFDTSENIAQNDTDNTYDIYETYAPSSCTI